MGYNVTNNGDGTFTHTFTVDHGENRTDAYAYAVAGERICAGDACSFGAEGRAFVSRGHTRACPRVCLNPDHIGGEVIDVRATVANAAKLIEAPEEFFGADVEEPDL